MGMLFLSKKEKQMIEKLREEELRALKEDIVRLEGGIDIAVLQAMIDRAESNPGLCIEIKTATGDHILIKSKEQFVNGRRNIRSYSDRP